MKADELLVYVFDGKKVTYTQALVDIPEGECGLDAATGKFVLGTGYIAHAPFKAGEWGACTTKMNIPS